MLSWYLKHGDLQPLRSKKNETGIFYPDESDLR